MFAPVDIFFLVVIFIFCMSGMIKGLIREVLGKVAVIAGIVLAIVFAPVLELPLNDLINNSIISKILAFILIFVIVFLAVKIVQHFLQKVFSGSILKGLDRTLGFAFGLVEGLVIVYAVILVLQVMPFWESISSNFENSFVYGVFDRTIGYGYFLDSLADKTQSEEILNSAIILES